jgi:hypothetical protein
MWYINLTFKYIEKSNFLAGYLLIIVSLNFCFEHKRNVLMFLLWNFDDYILQNKYVLNFIFFWNTDKIADI